MLRRPIVTMLVTGFEPGMKRRELFAVLGGAVAMPFAASAQRALPPVVGFLGNSSAEEYAYLLAAWREGLVVCRRSWPIW
jgi:hypothetical protein